MTRSPTGPRPQRHEIVEALDAFVDSAADAIGSLNSTVAAGLRAYRSELHEQGLRLLERLGVDTASVRVVADQAPHLVVRTPPHDTEV